MAAVRKREVNGKTRWDVTVTRRGAPRQTRTFQTKAAADTWARETERDIERGVWRSTDMAERTTIAQLMDRYADEVLVKLRTRTWLSVARKISTSDLGTLPLLALSPERVAKHRDFRLRSKVKGGGQFGKVQNRLMAPQTVRAEIMLLKRAIAHAMREWGLHLPAGNPVVLVELPSPSPSRERRAEGDEYQRILAAAYASRSPHLGQAIELAVETAMRRGEICNLRWSDLDLVRRVARARETKNGTPRDVPLSTRAVEVLRAMPRPIRDAPVFQLSRGGFTQAFKRVCGRLAIENMRLHDLRHEATSRLAVRLNGDVMALSAITGHKTLQMLKRYTHLKAEDLAKRIA